MISPQPCTLDEAHEAFMAGLEKGIECPCCGRFTKRYRRKFNHGMASSLIQIYKWSCQNPGQWMHVVEELGMECHHAEYSKSRYWGFLIQEPGKTEGTPSGRWMITDKGGQFVRGGLTVPKYIYLVNSEMVGIGGDDISIKDAIGDHFDYDELMRGDLVNHS